MTSPFLPATLAEKSQEKLQFLSLLSYTLSAADAYIYYI